MAARRVYEFGGFRLDANRRRLEAADGEPVQLGPKAFDALLVLVEHAGEPLSRRELIAALWPDTVVEENSLTQTISALRRVLGKGYIETLPGRGYQLVRDVAVVSASTPTDNTRRRLQPIRIMVLPLANSSGDPDRGRLAESLTEELIVTLQRLHGLQVTGRTTSFAYRDSGRRVCDIAADLGLEYVFEGSVLQDRKRLRVLGQLSDASGFGVWPYEYDGPQERIVSVRDEIVEGIARQLRVTTGVERALRDVGTEAFEAYQLFLEARAQCTRGAFPDRLVRSSRLLDRALELAPDLASAWMLKCSVHGVMYQHALDEERDAEFAVAEAAANRAIELAPYRGEGYNARALVRGLRGQWSAAEHDYCRAEALGFEETYAYPPLLLATGLVRTARDRLLKLVEIDPLHSDWLGFLMATYEMLRDHRSADRIHERGHALFDVWVFGEIVYGWIQLGRGDTEPFTADPARAGPLFEPLASSIGDRRRGLAKLAELETAPEYRTPVNRATLAIWAASFRDAERALRLIRSATCGGSALLTYLVWLPLFDDVRRLPGFSRLLVDLGIVRYWHESGWPEAALRLREHSASERSGRCRQSRNPGTA